jgi:murein DD-endopeptidase MepM/ murein hydrolase activator NlpD
MKLRLFLLFFLCVLGVSVVQYISAQDTQCGTVDAIDFPIDASSYQIVQAFGAPSPRHDGRYHTGDDWFGGAAAFGQPVYAIARGRVTYSSPNTWGRDGGVVIIEHIMPDGTIAYSMYGHMVERGDIAFPARFACVQMGDIIGAIGDIRPAPHLHLEIRTSGADIPGVGYEWEDPRTLDYRDPYSFITDWQTFLGEASLWHVEFADTPLTPPLVLDDHSLLTLNGVFLRRVLPDGRILWRNSLASPAVAIVGFDGAPLLIYADGTMQRVDYEGNYGESWRVDAQFDSPPIDNGESYIFHTSDNTLVAIDRRWRDVLWRLEDVPAFSRSFASGALITLLTENHTLLTISSAGQLVNTSTLREPAGFATSASGLWAYTRGGLWNISSDGTWALVLPNVMTGTASRALTADNRALYLFDGTTLSAYDDEQVLWQASFTGVSGETSLSLINSRLLLLSTNGNIALFAADNGALCGSLRISGSEDSSLLWHNLGQDGVLRLMMGRRVLGIDWIEFNRC